MAFKYMGVLGSGLGIGLNTYGIYDTATDDTLDKDTKNTKLFAHSLGIVSGSLFLAGAFFIGTATAPVSGTLILAGTLFGIAQAVVEHKNELWALIKPAWRSVKHLWSTTQSFIKEQKNTDPVPKVIDPLAALFPETAYPSAKILQDTLAAKKQSKAIALESIVERYNQAGRTGLIENVLDHISHFSPNEFNQIALLNASYFQKLGMGKEASIYALDATRQMIDKGHTPQQAWDTTWHNYTEGYLLGSSAAQTGLKDGGWSGGLAAVKELNKALNNSPSAIPNKSSIYALPISAYPSAKILRDTLAVKQHNKDIPLEPIIEHYNQSGRTGLTKKALTHISDFAPNKSELAQLEASYFQTFGMGKEASIHALNVTRQMINKGYTAQQAWDITWHNYTQGYLLGSPAAAQTGLKDGGWAGGFIAVKEFSEALKSIHTH